MLVVAAVEEAVRGALVGDDLSRNASGLPARRPLGDRIGRNALVRAAHQTEDGALDSETVAEGRGCAVEAFGVGRP